MTLNRPAPVRTRKKLENTYRFAGGTISILLGGEDTGGAFSILEAVQKPGSEPPLHIHHAADETFYLLEGRMQFHVGDEVHDAVPGDVMFVPRGTPHTFRIQSQVARTVAVCTPAGLEELFREMGQPAQSFEMPEDVAPFSEADLKKLQAVTRRLSTEIIR